MRKRRGNRYQWGGPVRQGDMNPPPRPLGLSSMMQQQPMNLSQNSLAGIQPQRLQGLGQGLGSAPFAPPQPARRPGQGQFPASSAAKRRAEPKGFQGASNPFRPQTMADHDPAEAPRFITPPSDWTGDYEWRTPAQIDAAQMTPQLQAMRRLHGSPNPPPIDPQFLARMVAQQKNPVLTPFEFAQEEQRLGNPNFDVTGRVNPATGQIPRPRADFGAGVAGGARPPAGITPVQRGASPKPWFSSTQRPEYLPDQEAQQFFPWARGGRVSLKTGGRIPRKKKGAKFI